jgi:hypothetical protein
MTFRPVNFYPEASKRGVADHSAAFSDPPGRVFRKLNVEDVDNFVRK